MESNKGLMEFAFEGRNVRWIMIDNDPWAVGKDVAEILGYSDYNAALNDHCKRLKTLNSDKTSEFGLGRSPRGMTVIPESDIYRLIVRSKKPEAEKFKRWIFEEVLPSIRKHGAYMTEDVIKKSIKGLGAIARLLDKLGYYDHLKGTRSFD